MSLGNNIAIIRPSSLESENLLPERVIELTQDGWNVRFDEKPFDSQWPFCAAAQPQRRQQLNDALEDKSINIIWSARGGYGASDLLAGIEWQKLKDRNQQKLLIGFSDVSALQSAFYTILGWPSLHAPMPATSLWRSGNDHRDVEATLSGLRQGRWECELEILPVSAQAATPLPIKGRLFGGCFAVLSNLIGTPYFPHSLADHIIFLEDTSENPGRIMRLFNQWVQSGKLTGAKALVLGHFRDCCPVGEEFRLIYQQFALRAGIPTFYSGQFGHISPNMPLMLGAEAELSANKLTWRYQWPNAGALA